MKKRFVSLLGIPILLVWPFITNAQLSSITFQDCAKLGVSCTRLSLVDESLRIIGIVLTLLSLVGVIAIIVAGVMYILSLGDEKKAATAKYAILYTIIGFIIVAFAAVIVNFVLVNIF